MTHMAWASSGRAAAGRSRNAGSMPRPCRCSSARSARPSVLSARLSPEPTDVIELLLQKRTAVCVYDRSAAAGGRRDAPGARHRRARTVAPGTGAQARAQVFAGGATAGSSRSCPPPLPSSPCSSGAPPACCAPRRSSSRRDTGWSPSGRRRWHREARGCESHSPQATARIRWMPWWRRSAASVARLPP